MEAAPGGGTDEAAAVITMHPEDAGAAGSIVVEPPPAMAEEPNPRAKVVAVRVERVPDSYIRLLLVRPLRRPRPVTEGFFERCPGLRECILATNRGIDHLVEVQQDMLRQYREKGYAMIGVELFDNGLKRFFILPSQFKEQDCSNHY